MNKPTQGALSEGAPALGGVRRQHLQQPRHDIGYQLDADRVRRVGAH
jgi:hypothetical protein